MTNFEDNPPSTAEIVGFIIAMSLLAIIFYRLI